MNANQVLSDLFLEQEAILTFNNACILQLVAMLLTSCVIFNCYSGSTSSYLFIYREFYRLSRWFNLTPIRKRIERNLKLKTAWGNMLMALSSRTHVLQTSSTEPRAELRTTAYT